MEHLDLEEVIFLDGTMIGEVVSIDNGTIIKILSFRKLHFENE
jgi:hypothetical protein